MNKSLEQIRVMVVDDDELDRDLVGESFQEGKLVTELVMAEDGEQALDMLFQRNGHADFQSPDIILLDLNMPKLNGLEVLEKIKKDPVLKVIPVVMLTSSRTDEEVLKSYGLGANCFLQKPLDPDKLTQVIRNFESFWLKLVRLPVKEGS